MARILVTQQLVDGGLDPLEGHSHVVIAREAKTPIDRAELLDLAPSLNGIVCLLSDTIDDELFATAPNLKVVANVAVGVDNIDRRSAARHGVAIVNTPGVLDASTADVAIFLMLATRRRTGDAEADLRGGRWMGWGLSDHLGLDLSGATLGLVGFGRIARKLARRASAFDMKVLHHTRTPTGEPGWTASLLDLAAASDILSIHVPLSHETRHLIDTGVLAAMKPSAVLINTARGPVVDEGALAEALEQGRLWGAGLDVYDREPTIDPRLLSAPRTTLLPHIGSATVATRQAMCRLAVRGALGVLEGLTPENLVVPPSD